jgi:hypothetical protein
MASAVGGVVVSKPMAKNTTSLVRVVARHLQRVGGRIDHADVAPRALAFISDRPFGRRHAHLVSP